MELVGAVSMHAPMRAQPSTGLAPAGVAPAAPRRASDAWSIVGSVDDERLPEISGVVASHAHPGTLWVHNDSGDRARVFAIRADGSVQAEVRLSGVISYDAEDIALGTGPDGKPWLWVADTGNNLPIERRTVQLFAFPEPDPSAGAMQSLRPQRVIVRYPNDGVRRDVETLLIDPMSGDGLLVVKRSDGVPQQLVRLPRAGLLAGDVTGEIVGELTGYRAFTSGDVRADGGAIVLRGYKDSFAWRRQPGQTLAQALMAADPIRVASPNGAEAICFDDTGRTWISIPEGRPTAVSTHTSVV